VQPKLTEVHLGTTASESELPRLLPKVPHWRYYLWLYNACGPWPLFQFLSLYADGRTPGTSDQPVARPLPIQRTTQTQNKRTPTSISRVGFEPTIRAFERAKTTHALARAAAVIGSEGTIESICACEPCVSWIKVNGSQILDLELIWSERLGSRSVYVNLDWLGNGCDPEAVWRENSTHIGNHTPIFPDNDIHNLTVRWLLLGPDSSSPFQFQGLPLNLCPAGVYFSASCLHRVHL
jgi:hypothetical protein